MGNFSRTKPLIKPQAKMKPLHWKKFVIKDASKDYVWKGLECNFKIDTGTLEEMFAAKKAGKMKGKKGGAAGRGGNKPAGDQVIRVLAPKRSNAIGIMASRMPHVDKIVKALRSMDGALLGEEEISALLNNFPTDDELEAIKEMNTPDARLDFSEMFCLKLSVVPNVRTRLRCWKFKLEFDEQVEDVQLPLYQLETACSDLRENQKLRTVLALFLELGNYMNGGTARGQADGFSVETLPKLSDTKDITNTCTLLEHGVNIIKKEDAGLLSLPEELKRVTKAAEISMTQVSDSLRKLIMDMNGVKQEILKLKELAEKMGMTDDPFVIEMPKFSDASVQKVLQLRDLLADVEKGYRETLEFFGMDVSKMEKAMKTEEFFGIFKKFLDSFKKMAEKQPPKKRSGLQKGKKIGGNNKEADPMANVINAIKLGKTDSVQKALSAEDDGKPYKSPRGPPPSRGLRFGNRREPAGGGGDEKPKSGVSFSSIKLKPSQGRTSARGTDPAKAGAAADGSDSPAQGNMFKVQLRKVGTADDGTPSPGRSRSMTDRQPRTPKLEQPTTSETQDGGFKIKFNRRMSLTAGSKGAITQGDKPAAAPAASSDGSASVSMFKVKLNKRVVSGDDSAATAISPKSGTPAPPPLPQRPPPG